MQSGCRVSRVDCICIPVQSIRNIQSIRSIQCIPDLSQSDRLGGISRGIPRACPVGMPVISLADEEYLHLNALVCPCMPVLGYLQYGQRRVRLTTMREYRVDDRLEEYTPYGNTGLYSVVVVVVGTGRCAVELCSADRLVSDCRLISFW